MVYSAPFLLSAFVVVFINGCAHDYEKEKAAIRKELTEKQDIARLKKEVAEVDQVISKRDIETQKAGLQKELNEKQEIAQLKKQIEKVEKEPQTPEEKRKQDFFGPNFGIGFALTWDLTDRRIGGGAAKEANGIVRVEDDSNFFPRFVIESHYFFPSNLVCMMFMDEARRRDLCGWGPFVAVETGNDSIINGVGAGIMHGFRYDKMSKSSWNFGIGAFIEPSVKVLGDGFSKNQPLPAGETSIRFKNTSLWSIMMLLSFSWNTFSGP